MVSSIVDVVVDDGSDDELAARAKVRHLRLKYVYKKIHNCMISKKSTSPKLSPFSVKHKAIHHGCRSICCDR